MAKRLKVLLDSSYILPSLGIEVEGLSNDDLLRLELLRTKNLVQFFYSGVVWIEILPKAVKEYSKKGLQLSDDIVQRAVESLMETASHIEPGPVAVTEALRLKQLGHDDMIDNLLYGMAIENNLHLLSMDRNLKLFLKENGLHHNVLIDHKELFAIAEIKK